jgi:hypothetical protein
MDNLLFCGQRGGAESSRELLSRRGGIAGNGMERDGDQAADSQAVQSFARHVPVLIALKHLRRWKVSKD